MNPLDDLAWFKNWVAGETSYTPNADDSKADFEQALEDIEIIDLYWDHEQGVWRES